jgi:hypothetical protein
MWSSDPDMKKRFFLPPKRPDLLWVHPALNSMHTAILSQRKNGRGVKLTTDLHLVPRLRMSGAIPLLSLHAFIAWTEGTLDLPVRLRISQTEDNGL